MKDPVSSSAGDTGDNDVLRIAILISGRGSNMEAILKRRMTMPKVRVVCVISDNPSAKGLQIAKNFDIDNLYLDPGPYKTKLDPAAEQRYIEYLISKKADLICLAGFMRLIKDSFLSAFPGRIINIHPSLLPKFPGLNAQKQALEAGEKVSGCTVHFVDSGIDSGSIIRQRTVPILERDNPDKLASRILKEEHILYSEIIKEISQKKIRIG